jgi:hypothetical protein
MNHPLKTFFVKFSIEVEYDGEEGREKKSFDDALKARRLYLVKYREGKNPKIVKAKAESDVRE